MSYRAASIWILLAIAAVATRFLMYLPGEYLSLLDVVHGLLGVCLLLGAGVAILSIGRDLVKRNVRRSAGSWIPIGACLFFFGMTLVADKIGRDAIRDDLTRIATHVQERAKEAEGLTSVLASRGADVTQRLGGVFLNYEQFDGDRFALRAWCPVSDVKVTGVWGLEGPGVWAR